MQGLSKKQMEFLMTIPQQHLTVIAQQLAGLVMGEDRDYKKEYESYHKDPEQIKRRAKRNEARRSLKNQKKLTADKDVHHKDNNPMNNDKSNLSIVSQKYNRSEPRKRNKLKEMGVLPNVRK